MVIAVTVNVIKINFQGVIKLALMQCPECGREISDTSKNCIHCGYILREENITPQQTVVHVEAPKKARSSSKFLIIGITLYLCALILSFFEDLVNGFSDAPDKIGRVAAIISLFYSLGLLSIPKIRKVWTILPYLLINFVSLLYIFSIYAETCSAPLLIPKVGALVVSFVLIFISLFLKDEKQ